MGVNGGRNVYQYVSGQPTRFSDPNGLEHHDTGTDRIINESDRARQAERERKQREKNRRENTTPVSVEEMERQRRNANRRAIAAGVGIGIIGILCPFVLPVVTGGASTGATASTTAGAAGILGGLVAWE